MTVGRQKVAQGVGALRIVRRLPAVCMLPRLCSLLALALLLAVLAIGNPFLPAAPRPEGRPVTAAGAIAVQHEGDLCPDESLRAAVVETLRAADGSPRWRLRDGRVLRMGTDGGVEFERAAVEVEVHEASDAR